MREAQASIDAAEFAEWLAFWRIEPFGDEWRQAGTVAAASVAPHLKKGASAKAEDFMPAGRPPRQSAQEIEARLGLYFAAHETPNVGREKTK